MNILIEAKAALCGCKCKSQIMEVIGAFCDKTQFSYSDDLSIMENAEMAFRQSKPKVSEVLNFADKQWRRL